MKVIISRILFTLLFVSFCSMAFNVQPIRASQSSGAKIVQITDVDWWPTFHHDQNRSGVSNSIGPTTNGTLWIFPTDDGVYSSPAVVDGYVYVGSFDGNVYSLHASDGTLAWKYPTGDTVFSSPAVLDGRVYIGSGEWLSYGRIYCLNTSNGALRRPALIRGLAVFCLLLP